EKNKYWSFIETRMSIPGCIELYNNNEVLIVGHNSNEIYSATSYSDNFISFTIPAIEYPFEYLGKNKLNKVSSNLNNSYKYFEDDTLIKQTYYIYYKRQKGIDLFNQYLNFSKIFINKKVPPLKKSLANTKVLLLRHLLFLVENEEPFAYLKMGKGNFPHQDIYEFTSASFLVKSVECASIFKKIDVVKLKSQASKKIVSLLQNEEKKKMLSNSYENLAYKIGDYFLKAETKVGVFRDCYSLKDNIWGGYLGVGENGNFRFHINTRTNGEALLSYLELAKLSDYKHKQRYLNLIDNISNFYLENQLDNGNYGRWWDEKGNIVDEKGTNGAYIFLFFIKYFEYIKQDKLYKSIEKAIPYYASLVESKNFFGDTLDADSFDKEAGQILLNCFLSLYEVEAFKKDYYLYLSKKSANYLISWIQLDNIIFDKSTPIGKRGINTLGYTNVSIANQHLDCYGMMIAYDFLRLNQYCEDNTYFKFAKLMINASLQLVSSPDDLIDRSPDYIGWIPEQINHTRWDYFNNEDNMCGHFCINIAWVQVLVLDYLLKIEDDFVEALDEV
ncbi:MAG: hypothetical protein PQJ49_12660, partial [Sphaerochaetaceae bacterium]|nr:hypothetical protein [Sphaerochaetaceae bacterium]